MSDLISKKVETFSHICYILECCEREDLVKELSIFDDILSYCIFLDIPQIKNFINNIEDDYVSEEESESEEIEEGDSEDNLFEVDEEGFHELVDG
tara:strand:- start:75 stop:359 length:285 start_codon:yes stop_codon:yes gene_type:complete